MATLYWDCFSGIAGNMAVASLLDAGADKDRFLSALNSIPFSEGKVQIILEQKESYGIKGLYFNTLHDHNKSYSIYTSDHRHDVHVHIHNNDKTINCDLLECHSNGCNLSSTQHSNIHPHIHTHTHTHTLTHKHASSNTSDNHSNSNNSHHHRGLQEIKNLLQKANLSKNELDLALSIFDVLAQVEAEIHNTSVDKIYFHEIGAIDSIADIVGVSSCIHSLGITSVYVSDINVGSGFINCEHGILPVPSPATSMLLKGYRITNQPMVRTELTTPTGAAIIKALGAKNGLPQGFVYTKVGHGIGSKDLGFANVLRAFLSDGYIDTYKYSLEHDEIVYFETNLDNVTGELLGYMFNKLFSAGALDVTVIPAITKKNRPAYILSVIANISDENKIESVIFTELPTLGLRKQRLVRSKLHRETIKVKTQFGDLEAKLIKLFNGQPKIVIEYDAIKRVAETHNISLIEAERLVYNEINNYNPK